MAGVLTWGVCALLGVVLGPAAGRPPADALAGINAGYPVIQLAVAVAVAATALPYLSRPLHRLVSFLLTLAVLAAVCGGYALPVNAISSVALGWGVAAALHLAVGSPLGLPSAAEITEWITDLNVSVRDLTRSPRQVWGVEQFTGRDPAGNAIELSVYGRDASDARMLAKLWRFCLYRDSGPTLILDRLQQVEHEAYLTLMAGRAGVLVPDVLAAGRFGPSRDAALVTRCQTAWPWPRRPATTWPTARWMRCCGRCCGYVTSASRTGPSAATPSSCPAGASASVTSAAHPPRPRPAAWTATWPPLLGAMAVRAGAERTAAAAVRVLDADTARGALVHLQRSALDPITVAALKHQKDLLAQLRAAVAAGTGIEVPKLAEAKRVSWANLLFAVGSLIGIWLIIGVLADAGDSLAAIKGASWGWVALTFVFAQLPMVAEAWALARRRRRRPPLRAVRRAGDIEFLHRAGWRRCRGVRPAGQVLPAPGTRRRGRGKRRRHRDNSELDRQDPAVPHRHPVRRRILPRPIEFRRAARTRSGSSWWSSWPRGLPPRWSPWYRGCGGWSAAKSARIW